MATDKKTVLMTSGGTGGPTSPLIAVYESLKNDENIKFAWIGTNGGPEKAMIEKYDIPFTAFPSVKLRRYFSWRTVIEPVVFVYAFLRAIVYLLFNRPSIILSAGASVSVPIVIAGWVLRIPSLIHQQDIVPSLSNKLMKPFAKAITLTFESQKKHFGEKSVATGNPVRKDILKPSESGLDVFDMKTDLPTVLVMGGGTGSEQINELISRTLDKITKFCKIIHITGGRSNGNLNSKSDSNPAYKMFEFLSHNMSDAYAVSDIVVTRAGMSSLSELSVLKKPCVIIPMPNTHQEKNAIYYQDKGSAIVLNFNRKIKDEECERFIEEIKTLINDEEKRKKLSQNISRIMPNNSAERISDIVLSIMN